MYKKLWILTLIIVLTLSGCKAADILTTGDIPNREWEVIENSVKGTTLNVYLTSEDDKMRTWFTNNFNSILSEANEMTVVIKTLTFDDVMNTLNSEKIDESENGSIDLLILKDDEFSKLKAAGYLYENVTEKLPNYNDKINVFDQDIMSEHGTKLDGLGVAIGRQQDVLLFDEDALETFPPDPETLLKFVKDNGPLFTYPDPSREETGASFVKAVVYSQLSDDDKMALYNPNITYEALKTLIQPGMDYLKELDQYIYKENNQYLSRQSLVDDLFYEGSLYYNLSSSFEMVEDKIDEEVYPEGAKSFVFETGSMVDTLYGCIPINAANKSGALIAINELLSVSTQINKYDPSNWGNLPVLSLNLLSEENLEAFDKVSIKRSTLSVQDLQPVGIYEYPLQVQEWIIDIWVEEISK